MPYPSQIAGQGELNAQQLEAVTCPHSVLIMSGPGTGKTRVIVERIKWLRENIESPRSILALTFTRRAAAEMKIRIGDKSESMWIGTFHALGLRFLGMHYDEAGLLRNFKIANEGHQLNMIRGIMRNMSGPSSSNTRSKAIKPKEVMQYIARRKDHGASPMHEPDYQGSDDALHMRYKKLMEADLIPDPETTKLNPSDLKLMEQVYYEYECELHDRAMVDLSDLVFLPWILLTGNKRIRANWTKRYEYILVDELQDVSNLQFEMLKALGSDSTNYFAVADEDQAIFAFRGARPSVVYDFRDKLANGECLFLNKNYRSTNQILKIANTVIKGNRSRTDRILTGVSGDGPIPTRTRYFKPESEARHVSRIIQDNQASNVKLNQMAVLYRNNKMREHIEYQLNVLNLPYRHGKHDAYLGQEEIIEVIGYLKAVADPGSIHNFDHSLHVFKHGSDELLERIRQHVQRNDLPSAVKEAVYSSGLQKSYLNEGLNDRIRNLELLVKDAEAYSKHQNRIVLSEYIYKLELGLGEPDADDRITLSTIHSAKGLEFDHVFLIGLCADVIPRFDADGAQIEEDRRLLYVGITRARKNLHMSYTTTRYHSQGETTGELTMLLHDVEHELHADELERRRERLKK